MILNADLSLESHCLSWVNEEEDQIDNIGMMGNPGHLSSAIQIVHLEISPDIVYTEKVLKGLHKITVKSHSERNWFFPFFKNITFQREC